MVQSSSEIPLKAPDQEEEVDPKSESHPEFNKRGSFDFKKELSGEKHANNDQNLEDKIQKVIVKYFQQF